MLINREIWQKVLPWNKLNPGTQAAFQRNKSFLLTLSLLMLSFSLPAEEGEAKVAVLMRGPLPVEGIEFLPPNVLSVLYGEYKFESTRTAVYYVRSEMFVSESWEKNNCGEYKLLNLPIKARNVYYYLDPQGWSLFLSLDMAVSDPCIFITEFIRRFRYFQGLAKDSRNISFPAVLQF